MVYCALSACTLNVKVRLWNYMCLLSNISAVDAKVNQWLWGRPHDAGANVCRHFQRYWITAFAVQSTWQWCRWRERWYGTSYVLFLCYSVSSSPFFIVFRSFFIKSLYFWSRWCSDICCHCTWCRPGEADRGKCGVVFCREKEPEGWNIPG